MKDRDLHYLRSFKSQSTALPCQSSTTNHIYTQPFILSYLLFRSPGSVPFYSLHFLHRFAPFGIPLYHIPPVPSYQPSKLPQCFLFHHSEFLETSGRNTAALLQWLANTVSAKSMTFSLAFLLMRNSAFRNANRKQTKPQQRQDQVIPKPLESNRRRSGLKPRLQARRQSHNR